LGNVFLSFWVQIEKFLGEHHLSIEDCCLVDKDRNSGKHASDNFFGTIAVNQSNVIEVLILLACILEVCSVKSWDFAWLNEEVLDKGEGDQNEVSPSEYHKAMLYLCRVVVGYIERAYNP